MDAASEGGIERELGRRAAGSVLRVSAMAVGIEIVAKVVFFVTSLAWFVATAGVTSWHHFVTGVLPWAVVTVTETLPTARLAFAGGPSVVVIALVGLGYAVGAVVALAVDRRLWAAIAVSEVP